MPIYANMDGHETEGPSREAGSLFLLGVSDVCAMLAAVELRDHSQFDEAKSRGIGRLRSAQEAFQSVAAAATARPFGDLSHDQSLLGTATSLQNEITARGWPAPVDNQQVPALAANQAGRLAGLVEAAEMTGNHSDWFLGREITTEVARSLEVGTALSRLSSLVGGDPGMHD